MSENPIQPAEPRAFDPWHRWLGIHPSEQPPHYYRMLGLTLFEEDPEVIETAANRQRDYIVQCAAGPHGDYSQPVLNILSAARDCLLGPEQKRAYDAHLRNLLSPRPAPELEPGPGPGPGPGPAAVDFGIDAMELSADVPPNGSRSDAAVSRRKRKKSRDDSPLGVIVAAVFGGICAIGLFLLYQQRTAARRPVPSRAERPARTERRTPTTDIERILPVRLFESPEK